MNWSDLGEVQEWNLHQSDSCNLSFNSLTFANFQLCHFIRFCDFCNLESKHWHEEHFFFISEVIEIYMREIDGCGHFVLIVQENLEDKKIFIKIVIHGSVFFKLMSFPRIDQGLIFIDCCPFEKRPLTYAIKKIVLRLICFERVQSFVNWLIRQLILIFLTETSKVSHQHL